MLKSLLRQKQAVSTSAWFETEPFLIILRLRYKMHEDDVNIFSRSRQGRRRGNGHYGHSQLHIAIQACNGHIWLWPQLAQHSATPTTLRWDCRGVPL